MIDQGFLSEVIHEVKNLPFKEVYLLIFGRVIGILFQNPNSSIQIFLTLFVVFLDQLTRAGCFSVILGHFLFIYQLFLCLVCANLCEWFNIGQKTLDSYCAIVSR